MEQRSAETLAAGLDEVRAAPRGHGTVELIVRRPAVDEREVLDAGVLDVTVGLEGDGWLERGSSRSLDGRSNPDSQITVMSSRAAALVGGDRSRWPLAGDQLYVDLDLSVDALPAGTRLAVGTAVIEVTAQPHRGCAKFAARFGPEALRFVNSPEGVALRLRGLNARVVTAGAVRVGDAVSVLTPDSQHDEPLGRVPSS